MRARARTAFSAAAWLALASCDAEPPQTPTGGHPLEHEHEQEHEHGAATREPLGTGSEAAHRHAGERATGASGENILHMDPSMLRDLRVTIAAAESRPAGDSVTVLGELQISEDAYAEVSAPIPARVSRVLAAPGDLVRAEQVLAELSSPEVGKARAALRAAQAREKLARRAADRKSALAADQIVSERDLETARSDLAVLEAEALAARQTLAALDAAGGDGARFLLRTPIDGTVIERNALLGRRINPEQPAFVVGDLGRLWLVVHAFERDVLRMRPGTRARLVFPALPAEPASGLITRIGSRVDRASRTVDVRIEVDNSSRQLRPGMSASALVPLGDSSETVVAVPVEALQRSPDGWRVFLPTVEEGSFEIRAVGRGRDLGGEVEVLSGLRAGERVVKDGAFLLQAEADKSRGGAGEHHH